MAEIVADHNWERRSSTPTYPWDDWLDGQARRLVRDVDFQVSPHSFGRAAHAAARVRGKKLRTSVEGVDIITIQAYEESP